MTDFAARIAEIDRLETHVIDRLAFEEARGALSPELARSRDHAIAQRDALAATNARFVERLRTRIASGRFTPSGLHAAFSRIDADRRSEYDVLDELVANLFRGGDELEERMTLEPEMVAYQPTPAREILTLVDRARLRADDVFYDLGSGLGIVVMLVALLTEARAKGVEFEPAYVEYAALSARALKLTRASFVRADVREASLEDGTVFFLYTPFRGAMLARVLSDLHALARTRPIRVCSYGPCTTVLARSPWLLFEGEDPPAEDALAVFSASQSA